MKLVYKSLVCFSILMFSFSCEKTETNSVEPTAMEKMSASEDGLEQEPVNMKNRKGDEATVVYFARGEKVAIKITMNGEEKIFTARGTSDGGGLVFSDGNSTWEMLDVKSGRFTDKDGNIDVYRDEKNN